MSGHLSEAGLGAALAVTAAAGSLAVGLSLHRGGVLVLLLSVLIATRWCGPHRRLRGDAGLCRPRAW